jgi:hypothetical protein
LSTADPDDLQKKSTGGFFIIGRGGAVLLIYYSHRCQRWIMGEFNFIRMSSREGKRENDKTLM